LTGKEIGEIEKRSGVAGEEFYLWIAGEKRGKDEKAAEDKRRFGIGFGIAFPESVGEGKVVY
jgi:hypothetical protein